MDSSNPQSSANGLPPKPWERAGSASGPTPFKSPSGGSTSDVVEASGTARPGEIVSNTDRSAPNNANSLGRPVPSRPWEQNNGTTNNYGGYGTGMSGVTGMSGTYGSYGGTGGLYGGSGGLYGGTGGLYGGTGGMYGNSMYRGGYGGAGGLYGGSSGMYGTGSMYGGGMYSGGMGGQMGGYGMGMGMGMGGPYGGQDPNDPYGSPPSAPGFWVSALNTLQGVVSFFGRLAMLIDQNTQAFHFFMTALLQLFDRSGLLYGELARFVLRILGVKTKPKMGPLAGPNGLLFHGPNGAPENRNFIEGPKAAPSGAWDNVWGNDTNK